MTRWAGALLGFDFLIYQGVVALVAPPPVDTAFETYQLLKHGWTASRVGLIPVPGWGGARPRGDVLSERGHPFR